MRPIYYLFSLLFLFGCLNNSSEKEKSTMNKYTITKSNCDSLLEIEFDVDAILAGMTSKLKDTTWAKYWKVEHNEIMAELTQFKEGKKKLFPYADFDSTVFIVYDPDRQIKEALILCPEKAELLLNVINNPLNHHIGEIGTIDPFIDVIFYAKNKEIGRLNFDNNYSSIESNPDNPMILGTLKEETGKILNSIEIWR